MNYFKYFRMEGPEFISHKPLKESEFIIFDKHNVDRITKFPISIDENTVIFKSKNAA